MPPTVQAIVVTGDVDRLQRFYAGLLEAEVVDRQPEEGELFFLTLRIGDSRLGLVADKDVTPGTPGRVLLSLEVPDVDAALVRVPALGGEATSGANDMPWGQRVAHVRDPDGNALNLTQPL
ncbi:extradiol dioxygenase [Blastococcus sp. TF02-09]|uniref:VOC family protein n=1 Tax=Blastococcus sp. TF02-09 TaxID=2250576 RepID=UPI000DEB27A7|nr:VOC family protein [Blastococcus sp. TF02-9]RBY81393.1 extradiol dioxygenase [Blastococcus sp. TF02-9]